MPKTPIQESSKKPETGKKDPPLNEAKTTSFVPQSEKKPTNIGVSAAFPERDATPGNSGDKITFEIVDGKLNIGNLRAKTSTRAKEALAESFRDQAFKEWVGIASVSGADKPQIIPPQLIGSLLDMLNNVEAAAIAKKTGLKYDQVSLLMKWSEPEHFILDKQGADLANKYFPEEWLKYADVGVFVLSLFTFTRMKIAAVERYAKEELERIGRAKSHDEHSPVATESTKNPPENNGTPTMRLDPTPIDQAAKARSLEGDQN